MSAATALKTITELPEGHWIDSEGFQIDADGEVIGFVGIPAQEDNKPFTIDDREKAEWALQKIGEAEAKMLAIQARKQFLLSNLKRQEKDTASRIGWLRMRFEGELAAFAAVELAGKKSKTLTLDHGKISFRTSGGKTSIRDMEKAVAWMKANGGGENVRVVESVTVTDLNLLYTTLMDEDDDDFDGDHRHDALDQFATFVEATGPRETVTITAMEA